MFIFANLFLSPLMMLLMFFSEIYVPKSYILCFYGNESQPHKIFICAICKCASFMHMKQISRASIFQRFQSGIQLCFLSHGFHCFITFLEKTET